MDYVDLALIALNQRANIRKRWVDDCLSYATPPIKGEVTKGKLRWRGIKFVIRGLEERIEQRGKQIGNSYNLLNNEG